MKKLSLLVIVYGFVFCLSTAYAQTGALTVEISGINQAKGLMSTGLFSDEEGFPGKGKEYMGKEVKVTGKTVVHTFRDVPFGTYAVAVHHDANSNQKMDKNFLGIPKEDYAFSNNVFGVFGLPPSFKDASFKFYGNKTIKIKITH